MSEGLRVNDAPTNTYAARRLSAATDFVALDTPANSMLSAGKVVERFRSRRPS